MYMYVCFYIYSLMMTVYGNECLNAPLTKNLINTCLSCADMMTNAGKNEILSLSQFELYIMFYICYH